MSDEIRLPPANVNELPHGVHEHWCEHPGCKRWGVFGHSYGKETRWFCRLHDPEMQDRD